MHQASSSELLLSFKPCVWLYHEPNVNASVGYENSGAGWSEVLSPAQYCTSYNLWPGERTIILCYQNLW